MLRRTFVAATTAFALAGASSAFAADLPARPVYKAEPMMMAYNWTGFYFGGHVGAGQQTTDATADIAGVTGFPLVNGSGSGVLGGVQAGVNYQMGWAVVGIEGAFSWTDIKGDAPCFTGIASCSAKVNWIGSVSGRIGGLVTDRFLAYVKGGAAWKDTDYSFGIPVVGLPTSTATETRLGYLLGIGGEYKFTQNWSGFTEYNYLDFGRESIGFNNVLGVAGLNANANIKDTVHLIKAGVNYKF